MAVTFGDEMSATTLTLLAVLTVSLISLIGVIPFALSKKVQSLVLYFVSFSVGALLGDVFLHILPEMAEQLDDFEKGSLYILLGIILSFILEKIIHWRHCHTLPDDDHEHCHEHHHQIGIMSLFADGMHNFIDGALIAGSFLVDINVGIATTIAVSLHEIPQELGDFAVLIHAGYSRSKALLFNFISGLAALLGAAIVLVIGANLPLIGNVLLPLAAGNFIYIAGVDLMPELHKEAGIKKAFFQLLSIIAGIAVMYVLAMSNS